MSAPNQDGFSQTVGLKKLNLIRSLCHNKMVSATLGKPGCPLCQNQVEADAFRTFIITGEIDATSGTTTIQPTPANVGVLIEPCKHNIVRNGKGDCKKCDHAEKERARRAAQKDNV